MSKNPHPKDRGGNYLVPSRVPDSIKQADWQNRPRVERTSERELREAADQIKQNLKNIKTDQGWVKMKNFPSLVYETENLFDDTNAPDMVHGKEDRFQIAEYGFMKPFESKVHYNAETNTRYYSEDQFSLPASEHFKRMRSLGDNVLFGVGFSSSGKTSEIFSKMVDKFERSEGGIYMHPLLDEAMKNHETTATFQAALLKCLGENINNGSLPRDIAKTTSQYMKDNHLALPHFTTKSWDLINGTVVTVHGIWCLRVYVENLEYKGQQIRGSFRYEIQDHFGLDPKDINHNLDDNILKYFEWMQGFRSWYLLQHYTEYNYQPFITEIRFTL
ncbi:TPA: DUF3289 family protein [Photobacterium damselae]